MTYLRISGTCTPPPAADAEPIPSPSIEVTVSLERSLMTDEQLAEGNLMTVKPLSAHMLPPPPAPFQPLGESKVAAPYGLSLPLPVNGHGRVFLGGSLLAPVMAEEGADWAPPYNVRIPREGGPADRLCC